MILLEVKEKKAHHHHKESHLKRVLLRMGYLLAFLFLLSTAAVAQPSFPAQPDQTPIDGGLGILAAAGGAYAYKKLKDRTKES